MRFVALDRGKYAVEASCRVFLSDVSLASSFAEFVLHLSTRGCIKMELAGESNWTY